MFTQRLRLEPITPDHAHDLWVIHNDDEVARWYGDSKPSAQEALERAKAMSYSWRGFGVHKWMAYHRRTGELIGRGGPSPTPADEDWGRINAFLPDEPWARNVRHGPRGVIVHANWVEVGWALRPQFWGHGYATEIGRASLAYSFDFLGMRAVVSCTDDDNARSRAVMERLGLTHVGTLEDLDGGANLAVYALLGR
jgi:RimJ/RimL family protein N-acetyltransferase